MEPPASHTLFQVFQVAFVLTAVPVIALTTDCPTGYESISGRCYRFNNNGSNTWSVAQNACLADGAFLVGLETPGEYWDIVEWVRLKASYALIWTSLQEDPVDGWHWPNDADRWVSWWPGGGNGAEETVAALYLNPNSPPTVGMIDVNMNTQQCCYICEYDGRTAEPFINVARRFISAECSTIYNSAFPCRAAVDGRITSGNEWASNGANADIGSWIQMTFDDVYILTFMRVMQRYVAHGSSSEIRVSFDGTRELTMLLEQTSGTNYKDYNGQLWNEQEIDDVFTSMGRIEVTAVYSSTYNGFYEIEFYIGTNPCPPLYTLLSTGCYRYVLPEQLSWEAARQACADEHADLVAMETAEERNELVAWILRSFDIVAVFWTSGKLSAVNGTWLWADSAADWFDWEPSQPNNGDVVVLKTDTMQLASASSTDTNRYICEYSPPPFVENVGSTAYAMFDWSLLQDARRATCMLFSKHQLVGNELTLVWHTDIFTKIRVLLWRKNFTVVTVACSSNMITMLTSTSRYHMAEPPCHPFCGILTPCRTQHIREDVEILECACPVDACRDIVLHIITASEPYPSDAIEICHLDVLYP